VKLLLHHDLSRNNAVQASRKVRKEHSAAEPQPKERGPPSPRVAGVLLETRGLGGPRSGPPPPDLVLNRHCAECEFQARCRKIAVEKDDLSLLAGMSAKERQELRSRGIFTVTQLSYTFRPRRKGKRVKSKEEPHHHALQALAIREAKTFVVARPEVPGTPTRIYLDLEGDPDAASVYLLGALVVRGGKEEMHSFWSDDDATRTTSAPAKASSGASTRTMSCSCLFRHSRAASLGLIALQ
jgi:hypothetical protein